MSNIYHRYQGDAELEELLEAADDAFMRLLRGQAGRYPARHLASILRQQGFLPSRHFLDRLRERGQAQGIRFDPRTFGREFQQTRHYRQSRPGYNTRIAVMRGLPVLYRIGGEGGNRIVLVGVLPERSLPPVVPVAPPRLREAELEQSGIPWYGGEVNVTWSAPMSIEEARNYPGGGVYIIERDGVPINVGETGTFRGSDGRISRKIATPLRNLAVDDPERIRIRLGTIPDSSRNSRRDERQRKMIEQAVVLDVNRDLANMNLPPLSNPTTESRPFRATARGVTIHHAGQIPTALHGLPSDPAARGGRGRMHRIRPNTIYHGVDPTIRRGAQLPLFPAVVQRRAAARRDLRPQREFESELAAVAAELEMFV